MRQLRRRMLQLTLALAMTLSVAVQPADASSSISDLVDRVTVVTATVQSSTEEPAAPAEDTEQPSPAPELTPAPEPVQEAAKQGVITGGTINVRSGPGTEYERVTQVSSGKLVTITGQSGAWYQIQFDSVSGYVLGDYLREAASGASTIGEQVVAMALPYLGTRYVRGGSSANGFDCSGFTLFLYRQFGYSLPHSATAQYNTVGTYVAKENLQPGDLVFFSDSSYAIGHVAIYIGNGEIIHARSSIGRVNIDSLSTNYYTNRYVGAKRLG